MVSLIDSAAFVWMWIGLTTLMILVVALVFFWGIRTRQFTDQDRARYLPLDEGPPPERES